jgi:hypothetical protein
MSPTQISRIEKALSLELIDFLASGVPSDSAAAAEDRALRTLCQWISHLLSELLKSEVTWDVSLWIDGFSPRIVSRNAHKVELLGSVYIMGPPRAGAKLQPLRVRLVQRANPAAFEYKLAFADPSGPYPLTFSVLDIDLHTRADSFPWVYQFEGAFQGEEEVERGPTL